MPRLFVALDLPELAHDSLSQLQWGLDEAHWRAPDGLHLTLAFLGEIDRPRMEEAIAVLSEIDAPTFDLTLTGMNSFGGDDPHAVWVGVAPSPDLERLQKKIEHRLRGEGFEIEKRRFVPHVTLASVRAVSVETVHLFTASHGLFRFGPFPVRAFHVYESLRGKDAAYYEIVASFALSDGTSDRGRDGPVRFGS